MAQRAEAPATIDRAEDAAIDDAPVAARTARFTRGRLLRNKVAFVSLSFLILLHVVVFAGPLLWQLSPTNADPLATMSGFTAIHPLGTDDLGRDELSRLLAGGQVTLIVGWVSMVFMIVLGVAIGAIAAFRGGWIDAVLMRLTDTMMAIPGFFFVLIALTVLSKDPIMVALVIGASAWMQVTRVVYGETLQWKSRDFVEAAHAMGVPWWRILLRHILPQTYPVIIVSATLGVAYAILTESAISYLGLGIQPPTASWGNMLKDAQSYLWTDVNLALLPGIAISLVVLAYNLLGDGLRDLLDPRIK